MNRKTEIDKSMIMERLDEDELFWLEHVVDKKVIDPGQVRRLVAEVRDLRAEREPVHPREQLDLDTVYYMSCTDDKCEFSLEQVRQLGTEVIESRRLIRELLTWAAELEACKGGVGPFIAAELRQRLGCWPQSCLSWHGRESPARA